jgi:cytochrome d ubiquinol oxidase subunit II
MVLRTVAPVWDGNEVWLVAAGGTLYFAFPLLYACAFSGFYLPLMIVLWLLIVRGIAIELRMHFDLGIWPDFFDGLFALASALLSFFFGVALANVLRGVPIEPDHYFFLALWTNFRTGRLPGILDWYTVMGGILASLALAEHGALYLVLKSSGAVQKRASFVASLLWFPLVVLTALGLGLTIYVRGAVLVNYRSHPAGFLLPATVAAALLAIFPLVLRGRDRLAFAASAVYLAAMLLGAAFALYPVLMPSTLDAKNDITIANAMAGHYGLSVGLVWWGFGIAVAIAYFVFIYWLFRGRVQVTDQH